MVVLEFCRPRVPVLASAYLFYFRRVLPWLGRWINGTATDAYSYLPASVLARKSGPLVRCLIRYCNQHRTGVAFRRTSWPI